MGDTSLPDVPTTALDHSQSSELDRLPIRILTHNIRYATDHPETHERKWPERFPHLSSHFKYHTRTHFSPPSTIVCMQEVLHHQLQDLLRHTFNSAHPADWTSIGVGRDDGATNGEYSPILFRQSAWQCMHSETVWLNETGEVGKKGWDASSVRILTCAVLKSRLLSSSSTTTNSPDGGAGDKTILALNTHLDDQGEVSRRESTRLIIAKAIRLQDLYHPDFTFLSGDLNSRPSGDAYRLLNAARSGFVDARRLIPNDGNKDGIIYAYGNEKTFTGFEGDPAAQGKHRIDFVHLGISKDVEEQPAELEKARNMVQAYGVLPNRFDDKVWMSDHRAVVVDLLI
ncbi:hypothetical protein LTR96_009587 [Exophiala xenobiotica]|nr:hypothetical protein LTR92_010275 [Exophiala xenobiotica]KAK5539270.1 hypothetical protein LTR23_006686 [Chaetothyriales sp. CCFEE 6169]KAK5258029.1 hypothetical protein LTR40_008723 [Exophiala xenobiotica]KAK5265219.1 hypothetical protein LTR96_009587 [Exophiala xenobiotica]KAK5333933.1 hypothetical protein LTR98_009844 [Exophiala xenobiotica]